MYTLQERLDKAAEMRRNGYNCASAVFLCFEDLTNMSHDEAVKVTNALGTGIGKTRELCGAAVAMAMLCGFKFPADPADKGKAADLANKLLRIFSESNAGCWRCAQLKDRQLQPDGCARSCNDLVAQCVSIAFNNLVENQSGE